MVSTQRRPNVIVIYTDQQRYDTLGCNGNERIRTPNIDRLAGEGVRFTRGYVTCPICVPSRVGLWTARYNHANLSYDNHRLLQGEEADYAARFREAGYDTALFGKNHCYPAGRLAETFGAIRQSGHTSLNPPLNADDLAANLARRGTMQQPWAEDPVDPERNITSRTFDAAIAYLDRPEDRPFLMWLSVPDPHPPYMVSEPYASMYDNVKIPAPAWREGEMADKPFRQRLVVQWDRYGREYGQEGIARLRRLYWGMVSCIDDNVARLMEALRRVGLDEDTLVVYTSDHGDYMGDHRMIRKGPHLYEALVHVPMIVRWPGRLASGSTDAMVSNIDIFPTLAELCDVESPEGIHGRSFAGVLRGQAQTHRQAVFFEHGGPGRALQPGDLDARQEASLRENTSHHLCPTIYRGRVKGVRTDRWKYCTTAGDVDELYDLDADPDELVNLAADPGHAEIVRDLRDRLMDWLIETEDARPVPAARG
jgi:arylsulfatase A-like enzyme